MQLSEVVTGYPDDHSKQIGLNTLCGKKQDFLTLRLVVQSVSTLR
jgi:hypothetical protein